jgi:Ca2+-binding RTX toxin-like protein
LTIVFLCCVTLGIGAVAFAQSGEEEDDVQGDLDNYKLQIQEDIEAMMECGEACAGISIEPLSFEEMVKDMQENGVSESEDESSASYEGDSTRSGICTTDGSSYIQCTNFYQEFYTAVAGGKEYGTNNFIVCTSIDGINWSLTGSASRTSQTQLRLYGNTQSESIGIVREAQWLDECHFDDFPDWFTSSISIVGWGGTDTIHGSQYDDGYLVGEYVLGHEGNDHIELTYVSGITPGAWGGYGNEYIYGTDNADYIEGNAGIDYVNAYGGNDNIYGGSQNDTMYGGSGNDNIYPGSGDDWCYGESGTDSCPSCDHFNSCTP